jgi:hypothetical protein
VNIDAFCVCEGCQVLFINISGSAKLCEKDCFKDMMAVQKTILLKLKSFVISYQDIL